MYKNVEMSQKIKREPEKSIQFQKIAQFHSRLDFCEYCLIMHTFSGYDIHTF